MSKRKKNDPNPEEEEDDDDQDSGDKRRQQKQQPPQKVYDFHKKTIEVYPERLRELNRQFVSSISSQVTNEPYSVLVGNCLDYVRQYFNYEDDLLKYSPWLATRLKQSRSDIAKCLQETIDVYEALARNDFDHIIDKTSSETSADNSVTKEKDSSTQSAAPLFQLRPPTTTAAATVATAAAATTTTTTPKTSTMSTPPPPLFSFTKPTTTTPTPVSESTTSTGFSFKLAATTQSPEKTTNPAPFSFSLPNTGFGTSTFAPTSFSSTANKDKTSTSLTSSISFVPPPSTSAEQQGSTEDNEDESNEPPEPEKVDHEANAKLTYRCRMGVNKDGKLVKRGPVQVVLKEVDDKRQLIVRSDDSLGRLYLNILWSKLIKVTKHSAKDLKFVCRLNPGMTEFKEGEFVMILFRFDNETERNDAYDKLEKEQS